MKSMSKKVTLPPASEIFPDTVTQVNNPFTTLEDIQFSKKSRWETAKATPWQQQTAPSQFPTNKRKSPRARVIAYNRSDKKLVVRFWDDVWKVWSDVEPEIWNAMKTSPSTGKFLWSNGFDSRSERGQIYPMADFDPSEMDEDTRVMFNQ
jgi:hypothetical protein